MEIDSEDFNIPSQNILQCNMNSGDELSNRSLRSEAAVTEKKKKFKCEICDKVFKDKYYLRTHSQIHTNVCSFKCDLCSYKGKTRKYLTRHKKKCHSKPTSNECKYCGKKFHYKSKLVQHSWVHTGEKPYECEICGKAFNTKYSLNTHKYIHTDQKPFECSWCEYACRDSSTLRKHEARHKGLEKLYKCKICDKSYKMKWKLKEHVARVHLELNLRTYECDACGHRFQSRTCLINHIRAVHERSLACTCGVCGARLSQRGNLRDHMRRHVATRPYRCALATCRKTFKTTSELKKHSVIHSPSEQFSCERCGRRFPRRGRRDAHSIHCDSAAGTGFRCDHSSCTRTFHSKRLLSAHMKIHNVGKEEFICDSCGFLTHSKGNIINHIKSIHWIKQEKVEISETIIEDQVEVKLEPVDEEPKEMMDSLTVEELCVSEGYDTNGNEPGTVSKRHAKSVIEKNVKNLKRVPEKIFDKFYIKRSIRKRNDTVVNRKSGTLDVKKNEYVKECVRDLLNNNKKEVELNKRVTRSGIVKSIGHEEKKQIDESRAEEKRTEESDKDSDEDACRLKLKFNFHQCYVCFKLFSTKRQLLVHCKDHFDVCSETMLTRCPLCKYVTKKDMKRHMREKHDMNLDIPYARIKEKANGNGTSRYCFEVDDTVLEVIPSVKNLNKIESMKLDRKRKELREKFIGKTKLVKKGGEWIVERVKFDKEEYVLPNDFSYSDNEKYLEKMREFSMKAKKEGKKMLFPCNSCEKKCQSLSALTLHFRKHEENPKPFKPKRWAHKGDVKKKIVTLNRNRLEKPKPILSKHKCDKSLMEFYNNNIRGGDIEFWQFLKIYNRMSRENVKEFEDLESRTDFGIHIKHIPDMGAAETIKEDNGEIVSKMDGNAGVRK